jgi:hypothetical protein
VLVVGAPAVLVWQERLHGGRLPVEVPLTRLLRMTGGVAAVAMATAGLAALFAIDSFNDAWPWEFAPLTGRLLGVWLCAFAIAWAWALWDGDQGRARPLYLAAPITGVLLALVPITHTGDLRPDAGTQLVVYYALALAVAAPGAGLLPAPGHRTAAAETRLGRSS